MTEATPHPRAEVQTIARMSARAAERYGERPASRHRVDGVWQQTTYAQTAAEIDATARGLIALGLRPGDRVGVLADTRREWAVAAFAVGAAGCVVVPVYPTNSPRECAWVLGDSGARAVVCEDATQAAKVAAVRDALPELAHVITIEDPPGEHAELTLAGLRERGEGVDPDTLEARREAVGPEDLHTIIYTSGTTGPPKGVVLTQANAVAACRMIRELAVLREDEVAYLFLPMAHVFAQSTVLASFELGTAIVYYGGDTTQILPELMATEPTYLPSVPRIFEKLYGAAMKLRDQGSEAERAQFDAAVRVGVQVRRLRERGEAVPEALAEGFARADETLYSRVRALFGGHINQALSAAAPIAPEILEFFYACGVLVLEAWGMTETTALGTVCTPEHYRFGTVGRAAPGVEIRIAQDGELLVRGPNVFREYWNNPVATAETLVDGWMHTGDLGSIDADGYLSITGRKKDIIITAGGKNLTPANLENDLKQSPFISQVVMHGDRRPYPVALITLDAEEILPWAHERGLPEDLAALAREEQVRALIQGILDRCNAQYAQVEQIKRFAILERDLTIDDGELTPTLKVRRAIVGQRYADLLDSLYA
ncbi:MAG TPA: long-chain fatty acid--CoA ligase [Solirubrobacteraceae bacterium]|nr:long-chain fatty acid--CoA ligase [Solirubrobacteraceae bacterium]